MVPQWYSSFFLCWIDEPPLSRYHQYHIDSIFYHHPSAHLYIYTDNILDNFIQALYAGYNLTFIPLSRNETYWSMASKSSILPHVRIWLNDFDKIIERREAKKMSLCHMARYLHFYLYGGNSISFDYFLVRPLFQYHRGLHLYPPSTDKDLDSLQLDDFTSNLHPEILINFEPNNSVILRTISGFAMYDAYCKYCLEVGKPLTLAAKESLKSVTVLKSSLFHFLTEESYKQMVVMRVNQLEMDIGIREHIADFALFFILPTEYTRNKFYVEYGSEMSELFEMNSIRCNTNQVLVLDSPQEIFLDQSNGNLYHVRLRNCQRSKLDTIFIDLSGDSLECYLIDKSGHSSQKLSYSGTIVAINRFLEGIIMHHKCKALSINVKSGNTYLTTTVKLVNINKEVTIITKAFGKPNRIARLVKSIRKYYPNMNIICTDDGPIENRSNVYKEAISDANFKFIDVPYDSGLSYCRNVMVNAAETPFVMLVDDDFMFDIKSNLRYLWRRLVFQKFDIAAAVVPAEVRKWNVMFRGVIEKDTEHRVIRLKKEILGMKSDCEQVEIVINVFLARVASLKTVWWDPLLKLGEHEDFFLRAKEKGLVVASCPAVHVIHDQTEHWKKESWYDLMRQRVWRYFPIMLRKHGMLSIESFGKAVYTLEENIPIDEVICAIGFEAPNCTTCSSNFMGKFCNVCIPDHLGPNCDVVKQNSTRLSNSKMSPWFRDNILDVLLIYSLLSLLAILVFAFFLIRIRFRNLRRL